MFLKSNPDASVEKVLSGTPNFLVNVFVEYEEALSKNINKNKR